MGKADDRFEMLERIAHQLRVDIMEMIVAAKTGHPGGSLSMAEILAVLYFDVLTIDPARPDWEDRDRMVLSKGHGAAGLYAALCERGYFPREHLLKFRQVGGILQGHPDRTKVPGVDMTTGSLGHGLAAAVGMAIGLRFSGKNSRVYAIIGDGECQEGAIWESAMAAAHFKLNHLTAILDYNNVQLDGFVSQIMPLEPVAEKWRAFGWLTHECNGHSVRDLCDAFAWAREERSGPAIIIAHTVKGKGVSFMENNSNWHGVSDPSRLPEALAEVVRA